MDHAELLLAATISIGIPLFIVAMASQNMPGIAVLHADGYQVPASPLISSTGIASILLAPFGSHGINLAAISAAICTGPSAHEDPHKRYTAALWCGFFNCVAGTFGATPAALFAAFPKALVLSIAAIALLGSIMNGLANSMADERQREAALVTFMVTASGFTPAVHRLGVLGPGGRPADSVRAQLAARLTDLSPAPSRAPAWPGGHG